MMSLCRPVVCRSSSRNHATVSAKRHVTLHFMHSRHEGAVEQDGTRNDHQQMISIDEALQDTMQAVTQQARDGLGETFNELNFKAHCARAGFTLHKSRPCSLGVYPGALSTCM